MSKIERVFFTVVLVWSVYHLYRDISTDILGIHNSFVDFAHRQFDEQGRWCGTYCHLIPIPLAVANIVICYRVLRKNVVDIWGKVVAFSLLYWLYVYLFNGSGPLFP